MIVDTQQLDKCNNNLSEENEALGKCRSKTSESLSKNSSNSSSGPVSSSSATQSSSSDVVSMEPQLFSIYTLQGCLYIPSELWQHVEGVPVPSKARQLISSLETHSQSF